MAIPRCHSGIPSPHRTQDDARRRGHPTDLSLRAIFSGGEALGAPMLDWARANLGCGINEGYGQTEANVTVGNCGKLFPIRPGSMGRPMPGHHLAVLDDDATPVVGVEGEIAVRSPDPVMMLGYWNRPDATAARFRGDWFLTGDLGRQDEDGYLWFSSRADDVIKSMGYRIGPGEIETSLMGHPAVALCAVVGEPDELRGQVPVAHVVLRPGHDPGPDSPPNSNTTCGPVSPPTSPPPRRLRRRPPPHRHRQDHATGIANDVTTSCVGAVPRCTQPARSGAVRGLSRIRSLGRANTASRQASSPR
jgi:acyl-CoA synthetase (AMP-forming)/AMP-acid ligase II